LREFALRLVRRKVIPPPNRDQEYARRKVHRLLRRVAQLKAIIHPVLGGTHSELLTEASARGELKAVARRLQMLSRNGHLLGSSKATTVRLITDIATNLGRLPKGHRWSGTSKAFCGMLRASAGSAVLNMVAGPLHLTTERTARVVMSGAATWTPRLTDEDFKVLAMVCKAEMEAKGIELGSVPCLMAEDETGVNPQMCYDHRLDVAWGSCGKLCGRKCGTIVECRKAKCADPHVGDFTCDNGVDMSGSYDQIKAALDACRVSTLARAVVVNLLQRALLPFTILFTGTCKTFTAAGYIIPQWDLIARLYKKHGSALTTSAARKSPQENIGTYEQPTDNTTMYIAGGLGIVLVAGTVYVALKK